MQNNSKSNLNEFQTRHIGPRKTDQMEMLKVLGFSNSKEMLSKVIPRQILTQHQFARLGEGMTEFQLLTQLKNKMSQNKVLKSLIGMGYHDTITPTVIQRNVFENPVWYTAYTPYQPEISQGRLEALLNFQTMICDLTKMDIANASMLDEGTATAEALVMAHSLCKSEENNFFVSSQVHPHIIEVLRTRGEPLGLKMLIGETTQFDFKTPVFAAILSYPHTNGQIFDHREFVKKLHGMGALCIVSADLLALTLLTPPGEWGADMVVGNSQRFGVPLGFGGPHAAFLATRDSFKRIMPGRLVGVSIDSNGKKALRLALQTREQHIRREKATSNICTAQVLLANMASMYAVYHGPAGLTKIAERIHLLTLTLAKGLQAMGLKISHANYFDTLEVNTDQTSTIMQEAEKLGYNFRLLGKNTLGLSLNETIQPEDIGEILTAFSGAKAQGFQALEVFSKLQESAIPSDLRRKSDFLTHPTFNSHHSETEMLRYIHSLQNKDLTLTHSMIPLGSCTMKLNATTELIPVSWPEVNRMHPFAPITQAKGYLELFKDLEEKLADITGFAAVSLQPNAGSQGELAGLLAIRKYLAAKNQSERNICLIPSSAHGTNPASAVMAGLEVVVVACDLQGNIDLMDLKAKAQEHGKKLAALMLTYPSTHGVFEEGVQEICEIIHSHGGQVYMDGANLNALMGLCRPGEFGPDVSHMNLHKTFAIPHGGGGPGVGPIGVAAHLKEFLPRHSLTPESGPKNGIHSTTSAPWGSASILPISWTFITLMGATGIRESSEVAILNANYIAKKLDPYFPVLYKGKEGLVAHECILDLRGYKKSAGVEVTDVAKRLMDYGFHAPTMSFPVAGTLMVEPTESESKEELDRFIAAMISIHQEIMDIETGKVTLEKSLLRNAPFTISMITEDEWKYAYNREKAVFPLSSVKQNKYWPTVSRIDNAYGDRNIVCSCPPMEAYQ